MRFRDLDPALEQVSMIHIATTARRGWFLVIDRFKGRSGNFRVQSFLAKEPNYPDPEDTGDECGNFGFFSFGTPCRTRPEVDLDANVVRASIARSCLRNPRWVRVGVDGFGWVDSEDGTSVGYSDHWGTRNEAASPWLPPFGPKVRAPSRSRATTPAESLGEVRRRGFVISDGRLQPEGWFRNHR